MREGPSEQGSPVEEPGRASERASDWVPGDSGEGLARGRRNDGPEELAESLDEEAAEGFSEEPAAGPADKPAGGLSGGPAVSPPETGGATLAPEEPEDLESMEDLEEL